MRTRAPLLAAALALVALAGVVRAESKDVPKDAAELFPAHTLAYLEIRQPDKLSREVAALCKGSVLEDMPARMAKARAVRGERFFFEDEAIGMLSIFLCPEMVAEFARLGGGAVALTGFTKDNDPEIVGVILSGESNAPTFFLRMVLTVDPSMRQVADFEGLKLYREQRQRFVPVPKGLPGQPPPPPPMPELYGPTYCLFSSGLIIGSTTDSVKEVIRRMKGKTSDPSLANVAAFRDQAKLRDRAGLFGYADLGALGSQLDAMAKKAPPGPLHAWNNYVKEIANGKAIRVATVSMTLEKGNLEMQARIGLNPKETSPLVEALPEKKVSPELLHFLPADTTFALTAALPDGAKRWQKVLALADAAAKAEGRAGPQLPSQALAGLEEKLKLAFEKDVAAKLDGMVLALDGRPGQSPPTGWLLVVRGTDAPAAQMLEEKVLPKLVGALGGMDGAPEVKEETVDGQALKSLRAQLVPGMRSLYFGRQGKVLVLGADRKRVAASLAGGRKKAGLLGEAKVAAVLKETNEPVLLGVLSSPDVLALLMREVSRPRRRFMPPGGPGQPPAPPKGDGEDKLAKELARVTGPLPPAVLAVERKPDHVRLSLRQPGLKGVSAKLIDVLVEMGLRQSLGDGGGANLTAPPIAPPPPPPPAVKKK